MNNLKKLMLSSLALIFFFSSCRDELTINEVGPGSETALSSTSNVADLIQKVTTKDGSIDNIIDNANCITVELPVTVIVNGLEIIVDSEEDFETIEAIFDEFDDDDDDLKIVYPVRIVLSDFTEIEINNESELEDFIDDCNGENEDDDDIECLDFKYPITISVFDSATEVTETVTVNNDKEMHRFVKDLDKDDVAQIIFPVVLVTADGTEITVESLEGLEETIKANRDACDEDDDFDYDDDDCDDCTDEEVDSILTSCTDWTVNKLKLDGEKLEDNYDGYTFNFTSDGTVTVTQGDGTHSGTWSTSGTGNNITVTINISSLPDFNANWTLHEIDDDDDDDDDDDKTKVDLRTGDKDRLRFESKCD